ncbi:MATE family efflux transporter [Candidatus Aerophobetes bacterium]|nr:MATE family efflux transporter [Candidatus Aerophobetes bacterium]
MIIGMIFQTSYNLVDGIWVAGLGVNQLAAVGLFFPFLIMIMALGGGIGIGGGSAISRRIGEGNKKDADNTAIHTILIGICLALGMSLAFLPFLESIFTFLGGNKEVSSMATDYARILFAGATILIFSNVANAILRGEGDTKRAMYALITGSVLNMILDPIYIYTFGMGVVGAAWATLTSMTVSAALFIYWLWVKQNTYLDIAFRNFRANKHILQEILKVGVPASMAQLSMSVSMLFLNKVAIIVGGTDGVAVFTSGWRVIMLGSIPLLGMATAVTSVVGAAFGAKDKEKLNTAYIYAIKIGILMALSVAISVILFSSQVAYMFTYAEGTARISDDLVNFFRWTAAFYPTIPLGMLTSAMFQGVGKGSRALAVTILRTIILQVPAAYLLGAIFGLGLTGVWAGIVAGNAVAASVAFMWGRTTIKNISHDFTFCSSSYDLK